MTGGWEKRFLAMIGLLGFAAAGCGRPAGAPRYPAVSRLDDLAILARELPLRHKNAFARCTPAVFHAAVAELTADCDRLDAMQFAMRVSRVVTLVGDGHTSVENVETQPEYRAAPLRFRHFPEGYYCIVAAGPAAAAVGMRLVRVGATPVAQAEHRLAECKAFDNAAARRHRVAEMLASPQWLRAAGVTADASRATYVLSDAAGVERSFDLIGIGQIEPSRWVYWRADALTAKRRSADYWYEFLPAHRSMYLAYDRCRDAVAFGDVCAKMWRDADRLNARRVVIDLRRNGGGDSAVIRPFYSGLSLRPRLWGCGKVIALIGRGTYSSAMMNALELRRRGALLVGEPTGGSPNSFGEILPLVLPFSGLRISYSTKYFQLTDDGADTIVPDLHIEPAPANFAAGRDVTLEAALTYDAGAEDSP